MLNPSQYSNSHNYEARLYLNIHFRTNPDSKAKWLFNLFPKQENLKVLELGCGTGLFWLANRDSIPKTWEITLTDYSAGMLEETRRRVGTLGRDFSFSIVDAEDIQFPDESFDLVLANNMLYHVEKKDNALFHIKRVLKANGHFIPTTQGKNDMKELHDILYMFLDTKRRRFKFTERSFSLDNGRNLLSPYFSAIAMKQFKNSLMVTEMEPIINYFLSFNGMIEERHALLEDEVDSFRDFLRGFMKGGIGIPVSKEEGAFICSN